MKKKEAVIFIIILFIAIISTINFLKPHYSIDTVEFLQNGFESYINSKFLVDGRIFSVLLLKFVINLPMEYIIPITYAIGIAISCIAVMYLKNILIEYKEKLDTEINSNIRKDIISTIIGYVIIFNFMYPDSFQFIEFPIIAISILLYIIASKLIVEGNKGYILKSIILVIIALFCYQGTLSVLIFTVFVLEIIQNEKINKKLILSILKTGAILLIGLIINYLFTLLAGGTSRISFSVIENLKNAFINLFLIIFNSENQYPQYLQLIFTSLIIIFCIFLYDRKKVLNIIYIYIAGFLSSIIILSITEIKAFTFFLQGRILFSIGALIGYIIMYLWCTSNVIEKSKFMKIIITVYTASILIINFQYTYFYMKGQEIDKYIITKIDNIITEYEKEEGVKIKKYSYKIESDTSIWNTEKILKSNYPNRIYNIISNGRRTSTILNSGLFKIYANREIEITNFEDEIYERYFENINKYEFNEERFIFIGDTVYIVL